MARFAFKAGDEWALKLSRLGAGADNIAKKAIYQAAAIVTDKIRNNLAELPEEKFRALRGPDEEFKGVPRGSKLDLMHSLGITPIEPDSAGNMNAKIGFDDYGSFHTASYPKGVPNQLLARAIESGSSVRAATPFVRPAVQATKKLAQAEMGRVVDEETKKIMK